MAPLYLPSGHFPPYSPELTPPRAPQRLRGPHARKPAGLRGTEPCVGAALKLLSPAGRPLKGQHGPYRGGTSWPPPSPGPRSPGGGAGRCGPIPRRFKRGRRSRAARRFPLPNMAPRLHFAPLPFSPYSPTQPAAAAGVTWWRGREGVGAGGAGRGAAAGQDGGVRWGAVLLLLPALLWGEGEPHP